MATRKVKELTNIEIDEISLVDVPANQHARVAIAKRAPKEDNVPDFEIYDQNGESLDPDTLEPGDIVFDADGNPFEAVVQEEDFADFDNEAELETVGKNFADDIRSELSKAFTGIERDEVIAKAMEKVGELEARTARAELIAKSERDLRLMGEYVEVAKNYNIPVEPTTLGPVLMRMSETMSQEDCSVIHKALTSAGSLIFDEIGVMGSGDNLDIMSRVDSILEDSISKSAESISKSAQVESFFATNPDAYDQYRAEQFNR